jgi:head-tail adaptor
MPFIKKGDERVQPGDFDQPCDLYTVPQTKDSAGGVINPADAAVNKVFAYSVFANVSPFNSLEIPDAQRIVGETWSTISIPFMATRIPKQGMRLIVKATAEEYEIRGVSNISMSRRKVELTCKLIQ